VTSIRRFMTPASHPHQSAEPQVSTTLKWASDGELSSQDLERILERLSAVDPAAQELTRQLQLNS
jgi:hypothetical protein